MTRIADLPTVAEARAELEEGVAGRSLVVFLDFDGTLSPIVDDPAAASLPDATRQAIEDLQQQAPVVIVSGRDADDVRDRVAVDGLVYAGSHGFDVIWPDGQRTERGREHVERLRRAARRLETELADVPGAEIEPKRFAVAVHHRRTPADQVPRIEAAVDRLVTSDGALRRSGGKQVLELRPDLDWDKGHTVLWLLTELGLDGTDVLPVYLGDDLTDEDAFEALTARGPSLCVVVRGEDDERATSARYAISDVAEAAALLRALHRLVTEA